MDEVLVGKVTHYFSRIGVAVLSLDAGLGEGDQIHIVGRTTDLEGLVDSLEIEHRPVSTALPGDDVAVKVSGKVRGGDRVYRRVPGHGPSLADGDAGSKRDLVANA